MPVGNQYPKKGLVDGLHRKKMLEILCARLEDAEVGSIEMESSQVLTTYQTLKILAASNPGKKIAFVMGADNLNQLEEWDHYHELLKNFTQIIFRRDGLDIDKIIAEKFAQYQEHFVILDNFGEVDISSTMYRDNIENEHLVLPEVSRYVKDHNLYGRN
jgi:nicotinate-nucleotide adenylyltransferase